MTAPTTTYANPNRRRKADRAQLKVLLALVKGLETTGTAPVQTLAKALAALVVTLRQSGALQEDEA